MKIFTFFFVFLYSILSLAQERPFILKVAKTQNGLLIPATGNYRLTVKNSNEEVINELDKKTIQILFLKVLLIMLITTLFCN